MLVLLRFGPRMNDSGEEEEEGHHHHDEKEADKSLEPDVGYGGVEDRMNRSERRGSETSSLLPLAERQKRDFKAASMRKRAHLASLV